MLTEFFIIFTLFAFGYQSSKKKSRSKNEKKSISRKKLRVFFSIYIVIFYKIKNIENI